MKTTFTKLILANCLLQLTGINLKASGQPDVKIVLAGDSTVTDHAGWGQGFKALLQPSAECINLAQGGRSSRSFRNEGWWKKVLQQKPDYVVIQFGHNDQAGKGLERESSATVDFRDHLRHYVDEARNAGATPVLVTPLTRRRWDEEHRIQPTLAEYALATTIVAKEKQVPLIDLHQRSIEQCNALGPEAFRVFEPMTERGADHTHLNTAGSRAVAVLVARELLQQLPELNRHIKMEMLTAQQPRESTIRNDQSGLTLLEDDRTITISHGENTVLKYNKKSPDVPEGIDPIYHRSGFIHPVMTPGGTTVTAAFPADHPHQHGVFSAWVNTSWNDRAIDFWNLARGTGRVLHQQVVSTFNYNHQAGFVVDLAHRGIQSPAVDVLRERWTVRVYPTTGTYYCFDIETVQTAASTIPMTVNKYHYGGVAVRGPTAWVQSNKPSAATPESPDHRQSGFLNDQRSDRVRGNHEHSRWVSLWGDADDHQVSLSMLSHSENFRAPQAARLHPTKPYFCFAPCVDGEFSIDTDSPYVARYRFLVTDSPPDAAWLDEQWKQWNEQ